ncbi:hypothetical protein AN476_19075 [Phaeobacter sp. 11ANDIMAR09]|nr:hypothetical protein AN476_19075 [Phaeobacter sp. 11ANDIMAR09]
MHNGAKGGDDKAKCETLDGPVPLFCRPKCSFKPPGPDDLETMADATTNILSMQSQSAFLAAELSKL